MPIPTERPRWPHAGVFLDIKGKRVYANLWAHPNGQWCRKHGKRPHYFGSLADPHAALERWKLEWPMIVAGLPLEQFAAQRLAANISVKDLANAYLDSKLEDVQTGRLEAVTRRKYIGQLREFVRAIGRDHVAAYLGPDDFDRAFRSLVNHSLPYQSDAIATARSMFAWAVRSHILERLPNYGERFRQPETAAMRVYRTEHGIQPVSHDQILALLLMADKYFEPVVLLGINCGAKAIDIATLSAKDLHLDINNGWLRTHRRKTKARWECPLWPETVASILEIAHPDPPLLRTATGLPWNGAGTDRVAKTWRRLCRDAGFSSDVRHSGLRHTARTIGDAINIRACRRMVGQTVGDVLDETYNHASMDHALRDVSRHIREWLFTRSHLQEQPAAGDADFWKLPKPSDKAGSQA